MPSRAGAGTTCVVGASVPWRRTNVTGPSRRGSRVVRSVTCVMNLCGRLDHEQAMFEENFKPVTPDGHLGGFLFLLWRGGTHPLTAAGGEQERPEAEDAPERPWAHSGHDDDLSFRSVQEPISPGCGCTSCRERGMTHGVRAGTPMPIPTRPDADAGQHSLNQQDTTAKVEGATSRGRGSGVCHTASKRPGRKDVFPMTLAARALGTTWSASFTGTEGYPVKWLWVSAW